MEIISEFRPVDLIFARIMRGKYILFVRGSADAESGRAFMEFFRAVRRDRDGAVIDFAFGDNREDLRSRRRLKKREKTAEHIKLARAGFMQQLCVERGVDIQNQRFRKIYIGYLMRAHIDRCAVRIEGQDRLIRRYHSIVTVIV